MLVLENPPPPSPLEFPMSLQGVGMDIFWIQWTTYDWNSFLPPQTTWAEFL